MYRTSVLLSGIRLNICAVSSSLAGQAAMRDSRWFLRSASAVRSAVTEARLLQLADGSGLYPVLVFGSTLSGIPLSGNFFLFEVWWLESRPGDGDGDGSSVPFVGLPPTDFQLLVLLDDPGGGILDGLPSCGSPLGITKQLIKLQKRGPTAAPKREFAVGTASLLRRGSIPEPLSSPVGPPPL